MKAVELRKKTEQELADLLEEKKIRREELIPLLREKKTKNVKELLGIKKDIARILTLIAEKRQGGGQRAR